jgi:hypothetical protein
LAYGTKSLPLREVWNPDFAFFGDYFSGYKKAFAAMVQCDLAYYKPEVWCKCLGLTANSRFWQLPDILGMSSQIAASYGSPWS